jgi:signal transduction histidine kinase
MDILLDTTLTGEQYNFVKIARECSIGLTDLINGTTTFQYISETFLDLLDLSKMEADQMALTPTAVDIRKLINRIFAPIDLLAKRKGLEAFWSVNEDVPEDIYLDEVRVRQVLTNLLGTWNLYLILSFVREQS